MTYHCRLDAKGSLCAVDILKVFDFVNHYGLMCLLMKCKFPKCIFLIHLHWSSICDSVVMLGGASFNCFAIHARVLTRGLPSLPSPALFAVYADELIERRRDSDVGCKIKGLNVGCLAYLQMIIIILSNHLVIELLNILDICSRNAGDFVQCHKL